jgi:hypothetical protein
MQSAPSPSTTGAPGFTRAEAKRAIVGAFGAFESFAGLLDITDKSGRRIKFRLNATQRRYIRNRTSRDVVLKGRQVGLTTVLLALMVYRFLTVPGASVAIVCQAMSDNPSSKKIGKTIELMFDSLERLGVDLGLQTRTAKLWSLSRGGAELQILEAGASETAAEKKGRGQKITHLHLTEVAYWEYADATLRALFNSVPGPETGSEIVMECTAFGAAGPFYEHVELARRGESGYAFHFFPWYFHEEFRIPLTHDERVEPRTEHQRLLVRHHGLSPECLKWWQAQVAQARGAEDFVNQEYPSDPDTCFLVSGRSFFDALKVAGMLAAAAPPVKTQAVQGQGIAPMRDGRAEVPLLRIFHLPVPGNDYVVACDASEGVGGSAAPAVVLERVTGRHMATLWGQIKPWALGRLAVELAKKYNGAELVVERNNHGHTVLRAASAECGYRRIFCDRDGKPGWLTGPMTRAPMLDTFEEAVREGHFKTSDVYLLREMRTFVIVTKGASEKAQHAKGARDDLVMSTAIGWDVVCRIQPRRRSDDWVDELPNA